MNTIHKYTIAGDALTLPADAEFLSIQMQRGQMTSWWRVDPNAPLETVHIDVIGTGVLCSDDSYSRSFLGTVQDGSFVWHVFRRNGA